MAATTGYSRLRGSVLPENVAMLALAGAVFPLATRRFDGDVVQFTVPVGADATITEEDVLADLLFRAG